jgi:hypothetical protein
MSQNQDLTKTGLRTPKAAAIAGIVFSVLLLVSFGLLRKSIPAEPLAPGTWLSATGPIARAPAVSAASKSSNQLL